MTKTSDATSKSARDADPVAAASRMFEQLRVPGVDMTAVLESQRKGIAALAEANRSTWESMQALSRKQIETLAQAVQRIQNATMGAATTGLGDPVKQAQLIRDACQQTLADMRELAEITRTSQADALAGIGRRRDEQIQQLQRLLERGSGREPAKA